MQEPAMPINEGGPHLLAILANPAATSGSRTQARVDLARKALGFATVSVVNMFPIATLRSTDIGSVGKDPELWHDARTMMQTAFTSADAVLLAYGTSEPTGEARLHHRHQVEWLQARLSSLMMPAYVFGDGTRHPSRWQRYTSRHHPHLAFKEALQLSLRKM
jgi:hypothetical protein